MTILKTIPWVRQAKSKSENYEEILKRFGLELEKSSATIDYGKEPVNICIMDGGGMKGEKDYESFVFCSSWQKDLLLM
jgi:hypothetical protein